MKYPMTNIHPEAKIAEGVIVEPFATIEKNVTIGKGTWIGPNVTIMEGARIGENCRIFPGAVISAVPQDLKYNGEQTEVFIGNNTVIRECVTINKGTTDKDKTAVGDNCLLMAYVHVAHDCIIGNNCIFSNAVQIAGHVQIFDHVTIGGTAALHQFVKVGSHAFVAGGSLVRKDVPPFVKAAREPLAYCGINSVGLKRRGFDADRINQLHEIYRLIYAEGYNGQEAITFLEEGYAPSYERDELIAFFRVADRGIIKGY